MINVFGTFQWDTEKSDKCVESRGLPFSYAIRIWHGQVMERPDDRMDYGEHRIRALGRIDGMFFVVVYTWRGDRRHIISARRAHEKEARKWRAL